MLEHRNDTPSSSGAKSARLPQGGHPARLHTTGTMVVALVCVALGAAHAQTLPQLPPPAAPASSTVVLASQLVKGLLVAPAPTLGANTAGGARVQITVTAEGTKGALPPFLADAIEVQLNGLAGFARRVTVASDATERIEVDLQVKDGHLMATARRRALPKNIWEVMAKEGRVIATTYANVAIDLELRTLLGLGKREVRLDDLRVVPVTKKSVATFAGARMLDCVVADLDNDRRAELIVLQTDAVRAFRWADGGFSQDLGFYPLKGLAPAEAPLREPLGRTLAVTRDNGRVVVVAASSDRNEPLVVGIGAAGIERLPLTFQKGWPLYTTGVDRFVVAVWPRGIDSLEGGLTEVRLGQGGATWIGGASRIYDVRAFVADGRATLVAALVGGGVRLLPGGDNSAAGIVSVLIDFDADGTSEVLTTSQVLSGPDRMALARLPVGATKRWAATPVWSGTAPAPVTAMCQGDVDRDGYHEVIAGTWNGTTGDVIVVVPR